MKDRLQPIGDRPAHWANWLDQRPFLLLTGLGVVYASLIQPLLHIILWYDELHTFYIAQAPTLRRLLEEMQHVDLNPPLLYLLVRASHSILGISNWATRLPSVIAFFVGSAAVFVFLQRRIGAVWSSVALALFWASPSIRYATEARPYGLLLAFFGVTLVSWDYATAEESIPQRGRMWAYAGIVTGNAGMMLSHVLAPLSILPFGVAELVRSWRRRRIDWAVWAALVLPLVIELLNLSLMRNASTAIYPPIFKASIGKAVEFYSSAVTLVLPALIPGLILAFLIAAWRGGPSAEWDLLKGRETPLFITALFPPVLLNLMMMRSGGPFWDRYCITTALVLYIVIVIFVAHECRLNRLAGLAALIAILGFSFFREFRLLQVEAESTAAKQDAIHHVHPELPFVVNAATTFLAIDHHEDATFLDRVYYLTDEPSALRYSQTNIFEGITRLRNYFPIRAHIESYADFAAKHPHFLVFGEPDHPDQWLLRKLSAEGAEVTKLGEFDTPYEDSVLNDVRLPAGSNAGAR